MSVANLDLRHLGQRLRLDRIVPGLVRTHLLHARATSPFGQFLSDEQIAGLWDAGGAPAEMPAWFVLGSQDIPTGTLWHLAFAPVAASAELERDPSPELLPEGLWVHRLQSERPTTGWCLKTTVRGNARWTGLWDGSCCLRLSHAPLSVPEGREIGFLERRWNGCQAAARLDVPWTAPMAAQAATLLETEPQAALLPEPVRLRRLEIRSDRRALRGLGFTLAAVALVTLGLYTALALAQHRLKAAQEQSRGLAPSLVRLQRLATGHRTAVESLRSRPVLLRPNPAVDRWLGQILSACLPARLEAMQVQGGDSTVTNIRLDLEAQDWSELNPLLERLRKVPGVREARFENQGRQDGRVRAQARLEGSAP